MNKNDHRRACICHVAERFRHAARTLLNVTRPIYVRSINGWYDISELPMEMRASFRMGATGRVRLSGLQELTERMEKRIRDKSATSCAN